MRTLLVTVLMMGCGHTSGTFEGLGRHQRTIATPSKDAQEFFNQGLAFLYAFNHDEAIRSFQRAAELDANCPMAFWGIAVANGPHINNPMVDPEHGKAAILALAKAQGASGIEAELIAAQKQRFADPAPADRKPLDLAYANAMREVWQKHPNDADVGALFAESLMDLRPWDLWTTEGKPQPETPEIVATLEKVLAIDPRHPLGNHLYIHAVEASPHPEKADAAADRLRDLEPGLGHLVHMPSHIDVRTGRWEAAITANRKAIAADDKYRQRVPQQGFYRLYMIHNLHMLTYALVMRGQSNAAMVIREAVDGIPPDWVRQNAALIDGFIAMPLEVEMRFGHWDKILAQPEYPAYLPLSNTLRRAARGVAFAAKNDLENARKEQKEFAEARKKLAPDATFGNNSASDLLAVAEHLLNGEIAFHDDAKAGIEELRAAVKAEDQLRYDEPPDWIQPVRHALGAALLKAGRAAEAEEVYREDLRRLPENGWSLWGLGQSLSMQKKDPSEPLQRFKKIWSGEPPPSSCFCIPGV
jgi:tetratricopeptide (TPR) repeat protein